MGRSTQGITYQEPGAGKYHETNAVEVKVTPSPRIIKWRIDLYNRYIVLLSTDNYELWDLDGGGWISDIMASSAGRGGLGYANMNNQNFWNGAGQCYNYSGVLQHTCAPVEDSPTLSLDISTWYQGVFYPRYLFRRSKDSWNEAGGATFWPNYYRNQNVFITVPYVYYITTRATGTDTINDRTINTNLTSAYATIQKCDTSFSYSTVATINWYETVTHAQWGATIGSETLRYFGYNPESGEMILRKNIRAEVPRYKFDGTLYSDTYKTNLSSNYVYKTTDYAEGGTLLYSKVPYEARDRFYGDTFPTINYNISGADPFTGYDTATYITDGIKIEPSNTDGKDKLVPFDTFSLQVGGSPIYKNVYSQGQQRTIPNNEQFSFRIIHGQPDCEVGSYMVGRGIPEGEVRVFDHSTQATGEWTGEMRSTEIHDGVFEDKMYYTLTDSAGQTIKRCNLDGTGIETLVNFPP